MNRESRIQENLECHVGIPMKSLSLVAWDGVMNLYLTGAFVWPLYQSIKSARLRRLAWKSLVATFVALVTSVANLSVLIARRGELGWLCLSRELLCFLSGCSYDLIVYISVCTLDVLVNTLCLAALTSPSEENSAVTTAPATSRNSYAHHSKFQPTNSIPGTQLSSGIMIQTSTVQTFDDQLDTDYDMASHKLGAKRPSLYHQASE